MRSRVDLHVAEARLIKKYHRLHSPLIDLMESIQDLIRDGMHINDKVVLSQSKGYIDISYDAKPIELVLDDGQRKFSLKIEPSSSVESSDRS